MSHCHHHHHDHGGHASPSVDYPQTNYGTGAKWIKSLTQGRLGTFNGGHYADVNLSQVLYHHRVDDSAYIKLQVWSAPGMSKPSFEEAMKQKFKPAKKGDSFGPSCTFTNHWWKVSVTLPAYWDQYEVVQFEFDPDCEAMIFTTDGTPLQGITGGWGGDRRVEFILPPEARKARKLDFVIESSCNGMFGIPWNGDTIEHPDMNRYFRLATADLVVPNQDAWRLLWDFQTLREISETLPGNTSLQNKALVTANAIMNAFDKDDLGSIARGRKLAESVFGEGWDGKSDKIYEEGPKEAAIWGIGHCHIDTAWLWPYRVTQQKVARSWSTQVDLMERYPEHRFTCSQAQQYKWLEQLYPPLFERVKAQVLAGHFHVVGGSWVENDSNMPSGEALARQFILGQRYFESRFGIRCDTAWLPDSFGLTGALPQLIRQAGMKYFFTQKLSCNTFPHSTFNWVGIDGTQVLCHMTPVDTYTAQASVGDVNKGITNHKNLESSDTSLLVFGNGDGGGGPLAKMLENLRRIRAAGNNSRELPPVNMGHSVDEFFEFLAKKSDAGKKAFLATLASLYRFHKHDYIYPNERINDCWEKVLLNQLLPGSAIGMVYEDAEKLYAEVRKQGDELLEEAWAALLPQSYPFSNTATLSKRGTLLGVNTTHLPRRDVVKVPLGSGATKLKAQVVQAAKDGSHGYALMDCSVGGQYATPTGLFADCMPVSVFTNGSGHFVLRNSSVQLTISDGRISSLVDVELGHRWTGYLQRSTELLGCVGYGGPVNFSDHKLLTMLIDVEIHHLETVQPVEFSNISVVAEGPLRASIKSEFKYRQSTINVTISLDAITASMKKDSRSMFIFDAVVDWHEKHEFLKFEVPLALHNDMATYETQFGYVQRPTHNNTTWDMAKFEVCGHKYADLSEFGYGVAILSESKYGFSCRGNVLRISLLRAATAPDENQDQGLHEFSWAVMPHAGHFLESDVPQAAQLFNSPLHMRFVGNDATRPSMLSPFAVEGARNVFLETVKRGLDDNFESKSGPVTVVLRIYEAFGGHAQAWLKIAKHIPVAKVLSTNLLEDPEAELSFFEAEDHAYHVVKLNFHGFEVKTIKIIVGRSDVQAGTEGSDNWITIDKPSPV
ncbi:glycoside hydrolase family 38 protein [Daedalea quercina L-15889]|uniref:alpha-mannosidase n=1 Tax=Daedalea quercina L-15889 TaxID=1314783 RepID=A0A165MWI3_9APHY|nr:glycoside hydrolase family 38 protein [Daedalea quercina L-15889]